MHKNRPDAPRTHCRRHLVCILAKTKLQSKAQRRQFISTTTNASRWRPCWLHYDDRRLAVPIINKVLVAHLVFSFLRMQKAFEFQSFENMLQSLQIFGQFFNPSHRFDYKNAPFVGAKTLHRNQPLIEGTRRRHRCRGEYDVRVLAGELSFLHYFLGELEKWYFFFFLPKVVGRS